MLKADRDHSLLEAIAQRHDEAAFEALLQSHQRAAFGLALAITGRVDRAEEAVQEAMLKIWRAAGTFRPRAGTTVRSWILRVVAREGLILRRKGRSKGSMTREELDCFLSGGPYLEASAALEKREALQNLQAALLELPASDRQLIALAFGAGMSHREIGKDLAIPSRTISRRLQGVLYGLRAALKGSDFPAAMGSAGTEHLFEALIFHCECPPGLTKRVLERIAAEGTAAAPNHSQPVANAAKAGEVWWTPLILGAGLAAGAALFTGAIIAGLRGVGTTPSGTETSKQAERSAHLPPVASTSAVGYPEPIYHRWTFETGMPEDLILQKGAWTWRANMTDPQRSAIVASTQQPSGLCLPVKLSVRPVLMTQKFLLTSASGGGFYFSFDSKPEESHTVSHWERDTLPWKRSNILQHYYIADRWTIILLNGEIIIIVCQDSPKFSFSNHKIIMWFKGLAITEIELREVATQEIPIFIREPENLLKTLGIHLIEGERPKSLHPSWMQLP